MRTLVQPERRVWAMLTLSAIVTTLVFCYVDLGLVSGRVTVFLGPRAQSVFFQQPESSLSAREVYRFTTPIFGRGVVRSSATATFEGRQERDSLLLTGLTCLIVGTTLRPRTRRHTAEHQPVASDALVSQTHLPLAS